MYSDSSGSSDRVEWGPRNMKSIWLPLAAIFFMTYFYRTGGGMPPRIRYWVNPYLDTQGAYKNDGEIFQYGTLEKRGI